MHRGRHKRVTKTQEPLSNQLRASTGGIINELLTERDEEGSGCDLLRDIMLAAVYWGNTRSDAL